MSLPPGFLDELRGRLTLSQVAGRKVMWDQKRSNPAKGDLWAPCPFHHEKTASFHVDDRKGYYYCFGCHAKGDAISFVRETENLSFMEAVEVLAGEAGMQMPARDPKAAEKADRLSQLAEVMEQAVQFFRLQLKTGAGAAARDYLTQQRGLDDAAWDRWEIGFAPDGWQHLWDHLTGKNVPEDLILGAGLAKPSTSGKRPYDTFRNRIMFPIRDARGRAIAFGGRAMDPEDMAKYLNSPETDLFDKGRSLFNQGPARDAAGKGATLIVGEGYMDVIALAEHGFRSAVAPLGTAVTEDQLRMIWRIHPEPVIALDGDQAGLKAAMRVIDLALPMLEPGKSLRFCLMPEGQDPDDVLRSEGAGAMRDLLEAAEPMVRLLWRRETEGKVFDSPERKAALDQSLRNALKAIQDPSIRRHYGDAINELRRDLFAPARSGRNDRAGPSGWRPKAEPTALPGTRASLLAAAKGNVEDTLREGLILAVLVRHPKMLERFEAVLEATDCLGPGHAEIQSALLRAENPEQLEVNLPPGALEKLMAPRHVAITPAIRTDADPDLVAQTLEEEFAKLAARRGLRREIEEASEDLDRVADEGLTWRLSEAAKARDKAEAGDREDKTEYDVGDNGALISRDEKGAFDELLDQISFDRASKRAPNAN